MPPATEESLRELINRQDEIRRDAAKGAQAQLFGGLGIAGIFAGYASIVSGAAIWLSPQENRIISANMALAIIFTGILLTFLGLLCLISALIMISDERPSLISRIFRQLWEHRWATLFITIIISMLLISLAAVISVIIVAIIVIHYIF